MLQFCNASKFNHRLLKEKLCMNLLNFSKLITVLCFSYWEKCLKSGGMIFMSFIPEFLIREIQVT